MKLSLPPELKPTPPPQAVASPPPASEPELVTGLDPILKGAVESQPQVKTEPEPEAKPEPTSSASPPKPAQKRLPLLPLALLAGSVLIAALGLRHEPGNPYGPTQPTPQPPSPPPEAEASSGSEPEFTPLGEVEFEEIPPTPPPPPPAEPFTGEEIVNGTAMMLALGLRFQTPDEAQAFMNAYRVGILPMLPPAAVLNALKVGEALAHYGIAKNRLPGIGSMANLPEWLRLALGGLVLAMSAYGGIRAARETAQTPVDWSDPPGAAAAAAPSA